MYTEGIKVGLTEEDIKEAVDLGAKIKDTAKGFLPSYGFGSMKAYKEYGNIITKFCSLVLLSLKLGKGYKNLEEAKIEEINRLEHFTITILTYGDEVDFAKNYRIVLRQEEKVIKPVYIKTHYQALASSSFPQSPSFGAVVIAHFLYSEVDPKARTTIILVKDKEESSFEVDFSRYK
ncbi:MAG: hypothetical protein ACE5IT_08985 [bacterium]